MEMIKYPKTPRLTKSLGVYDDNYEVVVEEKIDGANCAVSFIGDKLTLQSRGHILTGGKREFLFKRLWPWAYERLNMLRYILGERYVLFGEWMYAKNKMYYDNLPDYFIAFDIWDKHNNFFLNSDIWREMVAGFDVETVHLIARGSANKMNNFAQYITKTIYKSGTWKDEYEQKLLYLHEFYDESETDMSDLMEGIYIKIEDDEKVVDRYKLIRDDFEKIQTDDAKWGQRPIFENGIR